MTNCILSCKVKNLFYSSNYGYKKEHSTKLAALEIVERLIKGMDNNEVPINVFQDLSKAFDTLDHKILLSKLEYHGIKDPSPQTLFKII